jgi:hypothetical protein
MRYTKAQAAHLKEKGLDRYNAIYKTIPEVKIIDGYFVIESKMNKKSK